MEEPPSQFIPWRYNNDESLIDRRRYLWNGKSPDRGTRSHENRACWIEPRRTVREADLRDHSGSPEQVRRTQCRNVGGGRPRDLTAPEARLSCAWRSSAINRRDRTEGFIPELRSHGGRFMEGACQAYRGRCDSVVHGDLVVKSRQDIGNRFLLIPGRQRDLMSGGESRVLEPRHPRVLDLMFPHRT